ncbi:hypothetical protein NON00_23105 [Roseomonas sp. GC11]|uniref:hypothetical protein n=1 Tax=Roseomonas sp. GC11 TaxID=2950546 RepID=UPI00210A454F|nr:hypothetical protein [Roseomonas sp. GC11]MCQ4162798.1 hypothetical protein [Roseomonas sp. GC11]
MNSLQVIPSHEFLINLTSFVFGIFYFCLLVIFFYKLKNKILILFLPFAVIVGISNSATEILQKIYIRVNYEMVLDFVKSGKCDLLSRICVQMISEQGFAGYNNFQYFIYNENNKLEGDFILNVGRLAGIKNYQNECANYIWNMHSNLYFMTSAC